MVLAFPEAFSDFSVWCTVNFIRAYTGYPAARQFLNDAAAQPLLDRHAQFERDNGNKYVCGTQCSSGKGWGVHYRRIKDGARAYATGLTTDEALTYGPVDIAIFGDRVTYAPA